VPNSSAGSTGADVGALILRLAVGPMMMAHGLNKVFGPDGLTGTTRYFDFLGLQPAHVHARVAATTEIGTGALVTVGTQTITATAVADATITGTVSSAATPPVLKLFSVSGFPATTAGGAKAYLGVIARQRVASCTPLLLRGAKRRSNPAYLLLQVRFCWPPMR